MRRAFFFSIFILLFLFGILFTYAAEPMIAGVPTPGPGGQSFDWPETVVRQVTGTEDSLWLERLNDLRTRHGLASVQVADRLSGLARQHALYMLLNAPYEGAWHGENPRSPGYSPEGQQAAENSNLVWVENAQLGPAEAITIWQDSPEHRALLLTPQLQRVGFALACDEHNCAAVLYVGP
jgi:uncharacterized protein YkwD